jgi:hypothetical protein
MEQCRLCSEDAVMVAILDDGARVPYCEVHIPVKDDLEDLHDDFIRALRAIRG